MDDPFEDRNKSGGSWMQRMDHHTWELEEREQSSNSQAPSFDLERG